MSTRLEQLFSFGTWVRRRRKVLDLTQAALADRVGCAAVTIRKLEADAFRPSREIAERLADCLDIPLDERTRFLQAARGECSVDRLIPPATLIPPAPPSTTPLSMPYVQIPLDRIPNPAPLPPGSRMPLSRNPLFVGRDADLRHVAELLHLGGTAAIGQVEFAAATGPGGIGKTQLACEFVHRYGQFFPGGVFWLRFADPAAVPVEVAVCGGDAGMQLRPDFDTLPLDAQVQRVLTAWNQPISRLLVFDNCEDEGLLQQWRPTHGGCRVLLTSRRYHWDLALGVQALPLDVLSRAESLALLRQFRPELPADDADLTAIAEALGDLPLALHLAGSFLAKYRHVLTPTQYLERLRTTTILDDPSLQAAGLSPTQHVQHVARTFEQSYQRLDPVEPTDALARTLLAHAACCAPGEPLPRWLLLQTLDRSEDDAKQVLLVEDALTRLIDLGLLETDATGDLRLHRLLVAFVWATLVNVAAQMAVTQAILLVEWDILQMADKLSEQRALPSLLAIQTHRFIIRAALRDDAHMATIYTAIGYHLWFLGTYREAQNYLEQAVVIRQWVLGPDHPDTAQSLKHLGNALYLQGQAAQAQRCYEQALAIFEKSPDSNHRDTVITLNNLGAALNIQGRYAEALSFHEQALARCEQCQEQTWPLRYKGISLYHRGMAHASQKRYAEAQADLKQAWESCKQFQGPKHPDTAQTLRALGMVYASQGGYAEAQNYYEQALTIQLQTLGSEHPRTAETTRGLSEVLHALGKTTEQ